MIYLNTIVANDSLVNTRRQFIIFRNNFVVSQFGKKLEVLGNNNIFIAIETVDVDLGIEVKKVTISILSLTTLRV